MQQTSSLQMKRKKKKNQGVVISPSQYISLPGPGTKSDLPSALKAHSPLILSNFLRAPFSQSIS